LQEHYNNFEFTA